MDGAHGAARFFAVVTSLALVGSFVGQVFSLLPSLPERLVDFRTKVWSMASFLLILAACTNVLTFSFFASRWKSAFCDIEACNSGAATVLAVLNVFLTAGGAAISRWIIVLSPLSASEGDEHQVNAKEVEQLIVSEQGGENGETELQNSTKVVSFRDGPEKPKEDVDGGNDKEKKNGGEDPPDQKPSLDESEDIKKSELASV